VNSATTVDLQKRPADFYVPAASLPHGTGSPNLRAETAAIRDLSRSLAKDPTTAARDVLDIARILCGAGSAGLSLLREDQADQAIVHWQAISGALAEHESTNTPRDRSPCGLCLDTGIAILISRPERLFDQLVETPPPITEVLTVPLFDAASKPLGTLWVAHHDANASFHLDHARIVEQLAAQLVLALKLQEQAGERRREQVEIENRQALKFKDALIDEVNHRAKNTLQMAANLLNLQARASASAQVTEALMDSSARLHLLAKVHELLYAKSDATGRQSVFMPELLQSLGAALRQSFGHAAAQVALQIECDPMELPAQDAVALALLANEAITNAYKHAFPNESVGVITVKLQRTRDNAIALRIEDTGSCIGAPRAEGMGLTLIRTFATQLNGTLESIRRGAGMGTLVTLTIAAAATH
jgi:two-component sensor histidine kinase